jgi:hypothetical protein
MLEYKVQWYRFHLRSLEFPGLNFLPESGCLDCTFPVSSVPSSKCYNVGWFIKTWPSYNIWRYYHGEVLHFLDDQLPRRWVGRGGPIPWPLRSPDFNPLYFFWGYFIDNVYIPPLPRQFLNWRNTFSKPFLQWMTICYVEPAKSLNTGRMFAMLLRVHFQLLCEISSSHGGEYEAQNLLGCTAVFLIEYRPSIKNTALNPRRFWVYNF